MKFFSFNKQLSLKLSLALSLIQLSTVILTIGSSFVAHTAFAQITVANYRGAVFDATGVPIYGVSVVLEHEPSKAKKSTTTNVEGQFAFNGLRPGGPYRLEVVGNSYKPHTRTGLILKVGRNDLVYVNLEKTETVNVVGQRVLRASTKRVYSEDDIRNNASVSQDIKDIVKLNPDAYLEGDALSIGGANNRFNSITIDGIRQDDDFGLNGNGYPTQRSPISLQATQEISVERSPFDVRYRNFLGGNVNVVTKSGTNEFEGSVMTTFSGKGLTGEKLKDQAYEYRASEQRLGLSLGGPIIKDKLHFFFNAEGLQADEPNTVGLAGSGQPTEVTQVNAEEVSRAQQISKDVYGFDAGSVGQDIQVDDIKLLGKVDWTINDDHRLETKYQHVSGNQISSGSASEDELSLTSAWYNRRDTLDTFSLRLFSDWSAELSTRLEYNQKKVKTQQVPLNGSNFMAAEITTPRNEDTGEGRDGTINLGPDPFRHANELENASQFVSAELTYLMGDHQYIAGIEHESLQINNLFLAYANGQATYDSLDDFAAKNPSRISYSTSSSYDAEDARADWGYGVTSLYLQDEFSLSERVTARFGLRGEFYNSSSEVTRNDTFYERYGFDNTSNLDGKQAIMPRLGFNIQAAPKLALRTGFGLYSGGTPNVWVSNSYTNNGLNVSSANVSDGINGFDGRNIPQSVKDEVIFGGGNVDALDPDFKIPQSWKASFGGNYSFDIPSVTNNILLDFDYTYSKVRYGLQWKDLRRNHDSIAGNSPTVKGPDGRDLYDTDPATDSGEDFNIYRGYDMLLTNTDKGYSHTASMTLSKYFSNGFNLSAAYAYQDVKEISPATSSRSVSNYGQSAVGLDPNDPELARSNYERKHRTLLRAGYVNDFIDGLATSMSLLWERRSGQPYSYTFGGDRNNLASLFGEDREFAKRRRMLFYVPKGDGSDVILDGIDETAFNNYLKKTGLDKYRGKISPRNAFFASWISEIDLRLSQELPGFDSSNRARIVFDIENLPNLINKNWGQNSYLGFPYFVSPVDVSFDKDTGKYVYSNFDDSDKQRASLSQSIWKMQVAVYYEF